MSVAFKSVLRSVSACCAILTATPCVLAQDGSGPAGAPSTVVYEAEFFSRYNVISVTDMLRRIPGASEILDARRQDVRGFGSGGDQILINGERIAGKANDIGSALQRIQASQVTRIELIRGTSPELDVRSEGLIINIVLEGDGPKSAGSWQAAGRYIEGGHFRPEASLSIGGDRGRLNYFVSLEADSFFRRRLIDDRFFTPGDNRLFERRDEEVINRFRRYTLTTNLSYRFARGDELRVNGLVEHRRFTSNEISNQFTFDSAGMEGSQIEPRRFVSSAVKWELGADFERKIGKTGRLKILFVHTDDNGDEAENQRRIADGLDLLTNVQATDTLTRETILRPSYKWDLSKKQNIEIGIEGALNTLDTALEVFENQDGMLAPVGIFNPDSTVEEVRVEGFATHIWKLADRLTLESALNGEYSTLKQTGSDVQERRTFFFLKPRADIRFDITPARQIRLKAERTVSQLDFGDFVSTFDEEDDLADAGNPDLVPEKAWEFELAYEQRLANDGGVIKTRLFYNDISAKIDRIVGNLAGDRSAVGNVGGASFYGVETSGSLRLAKIGVPDAVVTAGVTGQRSRLTDAFTGNRRSFSRTPNYKWNVGFRHDTQTRRSLSYGFDLEKQGPRTVDDIDEHRDFSDRPNLSFFAETKILGGMTLRLEGRRLLRDKAVRDRVRFVGNKVNQELLQTEMRTREIARTFSLILRGNF
ncbi:MAG: TonB-dependent receptor plug domain-containing protein [Sphingomonadales bacterium]